MCGLACSLNPEHHTVIRRVVGRAIADKVNCHASLEGHILPLLLGLIQPSVISLVGKDRDVSVEFANNKVVEWREIASSASSLSMQANAKSVKDLGLTYSSVAADEVKEKIAAICLSFEEFTGSSMDSLQAIAASKQQRNQAVWFDSLCKIVPHADRLTSAVKSWSNTSAPSAAHPSNPMPGYDDDFTHLSAPLPLLSTSSSLKSSLVSSVSETADSLVRTDTLSSTEFMSPWQSPQELEEDAEDELAGDVYPYGDYLYGTAESSARGIGVGGAGGVVLDLSGVPELIPPMPRQRTSGPATSSRYRGVCRSKRTATDKWQAQISYGGTNYYLGLFDSEAEAGVAYARAHYKFYGAGSVGLSSYAVGSGSGKSSGAGGASSTPNSAPATDGADSSSDVQTDNGTSEELSESIDPLSESDSNSFRLVCSSAVAAAVKLGVNDSSEGVLSLNWSDELDKKYWVSAEDSEVGGSFKGSNTGRPSTPTKSLGDKEKKRKGSKASVDDSSSEVGLQSMVYINDESSSDWPFSGALTSSSFNPATSITHPGMTDSASKDSLLSLEYSAAWPSIANSSSTSNSSEVPPIAFAMSMLRPLVELKKQEESLHALTAKHILILEAKEALDASLANSSTMDSSDVGYAKLIGFVVSSKSNANLAGFHTTISKSNFSVGNAAHEIPLAGRAGISSWSRAMSNICGTSVAASASLLTCGAAVGDLDIHLGDNIAVHTHLYSLLHTHILLILSTI